MTKDANIIDKWIGTDHDDMPTVQLRLLDAAAKAFTVHGFSAASIDLIASQIGATKGSVYYHYRSKIDLFIAVHRRAMAMNLKAQVPLVRDEALGVAEKLEQMAYRHAKLMMEAFYYQRVTVQGVDLYQSVSTTPREREALAEIVCMRDAYEGLFIQVVEAGRKNGTFSVPNASLAAKAILGMLNWITVWYRPRENEDPGYQNQVASQLARQAVKSVLA